MKRCANTPGREQTHKGGNRTIRSGFFQDAREVPRRYSCKLYLVTQIILEAVKLGVVKVCLLFVVLKKQLRISKQ